MSETIKKDVVIIGAGLTGLTAAYYAKKLGLNIVVIEKNNRVGGVIQTIRENGFVFEAGPNTGVVSHPEVAELFEDLAKYCTLEIANKEAKRRLIWKSGRWNALPGGLAQAVKTPLFTVKDKFRILAEPFRKRGDNPYESVAGLVKRRLGESYLDYAVDPFISGVYAGDPSLLITRFALPKLHALEQDYGSFIRGSVRKGFQKKDERLKKATREVFSAVNGLGSLIDALATVVENGNIMLNASNTVVQPAGKGYEVVTTVDGSSVTFSATYVISTADAEALPSLLPFVSARELGAITNLRYAKVMQVILGFKKWEGISLNAFGGLVPTKEKRDILGVLFTSSFLSNRAPADGALLSVFIGGVKRPELFELSDDQLKELVFREVKEMMSLDSVNPDMLHIFRYSKAIPQYERSSEARFKAIDDIQNRFPGLVLAGGIRNGIGMADRIKQACTIIEDIKVRNQGH